MYGFTQMCLDTTKACGPYALDIRQSAASGVCVDEAVLDLAAPSLVVCLIE